MQFPFEISNKNEFDAVGFGTNAVDVLIRVPEYPEFNSKVRLSDHVRSAGGEAASTMASLQRLGMKTSYIGRFGDDEAGDIGIGSLIDEGVDVSAAERVKGAATQIGFILVDERTGERTVIWGRDERLGYKAREAPIGSAILGRVLHITPHDTGACVRLAKAARKKGVIVSADIDNVFDGIDVLLPFVDVLIASADLPQKLTGIAGPGITLREIVSKFGCAVAGITLGVRGSLILCEDSFVETGGFDVPGGCVDTTGAGDAFRAGFLYGMLIGETVEESALIANAVAALKCRAIGARTALPTKKELTTLLKKYRH